MNEKALEILRQTNDGSGLSPKALNLLQGAVNGHLSDYGLAAFETLHKNVMAGTYDKSKDYYYGVEHMTKDNTGYIYYKGMCVEHFSYRNAEADRANELLALKRLKARCELLEQKKIEIHIGTAILQVEKYLSPAEIAGIDEALKAAA